MGSLTTSDRRKAAPQRRPRAAAAQSPAGAAAAPQSGGRYHGEARGVPRTLATWRAPRPGHPAAGGGRARAPGAPPTDACVVLPLLPGRSFQEMDPQESAFLTCCQATDRIYHQKQSIQIQSYIVN